MINDLDELVRAAVAEVFSTMLNCEARPEPGEIPKLNGEMHIAGSVGFIGPITGVIYVYVSGRFARQITCRMLGLAEREVESDEIVHDTIGELTNMVVGHLKSRLSDRGLNCSLTIPSIVCGSQFSIEPISCALRRAYRFRCDGDQTLLAVAILKAPDEKIATKTH
jgi:chemotaxis protein CheX